MKEEEEEEGGGEAIDIGMHDNMEVVGFLQIENFEGKSMHLNIHYLKKALNVVDALDEEACDIEIGITDRAPAGVFYIFLDENRSAAIAVAGRTE